MAGNLQSLWTWYSTRKGVFRRRVVKTLTVRKATINQTYTKGLRVSPQYSRFRCLSSWGAAASIIWSNRNAVNAVRKMNKMQPSACRSYVGFLVPKLLPYTLLGYPCGKFNKTWFHRDFGFFEFDWVNYSVRSRNFICFIFSPTPWHCLILVSEWCTLGIFRISGGLHSLLTYFSFQRCASALVWSST